MVKKHRSMFKAAIVGVVCLVVVVGCESSGGLERSAIENSGLVYAVPKHRLLVSGTITYEYSNKVNEDLEIEAKTRVKSVDLTASLESLPDQVFSIDLPASTFLEDTFSVAVNDQGYLTSLEADSIGKAGDVITNVAKVAGTFAGAVLGLDEPVAKAGSFGKLSLPPSLDAGEVEARFDALPPVEKLYLDESETGRSRWVDLVGIHLQLEQADARLDQLNRDVTQATTTDSAEETLTLRNAVEFARESLEKRRGAITTAYAAGLDVFEAEKNIGKASELVKFSQVFEIKEVPKFSLAHLIDTSGDVALPLTQDEVAKRIAETPDSEKMLELWNTYGVLFTLVPHGSDKAGFTHQNPVDGAMVVHYRTPRPRMLHAYLLDEVPISIETAPRDQDGTPEEIYEQLEQRAVLDSRTLVQVLDPSDPARTLTLDRNIFSQRKLALTFDSNGVPRSLKRETTAAAAEATKAADAAATGSLAAVQSALTGVAGIRSTRRQIRLDELKAKTQVLQERKNIVDAKIALDGALATSSLQREKATLDSQLATLKAQFDLANAQPSQDLVEVTTQLNTLGQQIELRKALATGDLDVLAAILSDQATILQSRQALVTGERNLRSALELGDVTSEVARLRQELELIRLQNELEGLRKAQTP